MIKSAALRLVAAVVTVGLPKAQSEAPLAFETASVKQHPVSSGIMRRYPSSTIQCPGIGHCGIVGNRFTDDVASLKDLIMDAYSVKPFQISGLPSWGNSGHDVYDVTATVGGTGTPTLDRVRPMLRKLLSDRFGLKLHHEVKELSVYVLVIAKNGSKLTAGTCPKGGGLPAPSPEGTAFLRSWERIETLLAVWAGRPVIDKTGLEGTYCTLDGEDPLMAVLSRLPPPGASASANASARPSVFALVAEKWGTVLEPQNLLMDVLIVDHAERPGP